MAKEVFAIEVSSALLIPRLKVNLPDPESNPNPRMRPNSSKMLNPGHSIQGAMQPGCHLSSIMIDIQVYH